MTPFSLRLAGIAAALLDTHSDISAELSSISVEVARLERAQRRPADVLPFCRTPRRCGNDPMGAA